ncbi:MAG TPA: NINE protein [Coleofasciculaceae cyanobacterium]
MKDNPDSGLHWIGTSTFPDCMLSKPKDRRIAALLALAGAILPVSGFHKFYMGQPKWGILYVLLSATMIPKVASAIEAIWYLFQDADEFAQSSGAVTQKTRPIQTIAAADALRQLEQLRLEGLVSEYEFEQKRRQLLDRIG